MLAFGVNKLEKMSESHLDAMDPYQRSASDISKYHFVWFFCLVGNFNVEIVWNEMTSMRLQASECRLNDSVRQVKALQRT